ncbi:MULTISPECIES: FAD-binding oxidoreductase [unclassified Streptomyces]|uniref:NAD(P)/FAD-dependent oxidoreductase n=1 Tax=unclassified Streptomyces TaxID=2593676 RepID=UPI000DB9E4E9|nr:MULTISPECIES: FAD-binding oxidoreductase [unclassified Streptomyces]MYT71893.1 FAD-dependent oxidoreductase [Streptomyces sp. SID8367]RAJ75273.1 glycine/D-amino acid oxidase-like deaminating enzyme [Streptomyces sp. PsTaAH-137]
MNRVVVVGAGVLGACVTYHLARAGAHVVLVEGAPGPAAGTSGATFAADVTHLKTPYAYYRLNRQGSEGHLRLAEEIGGPRWRHPLPLVQWADDEDGQRALRERTGRAREWGHDCRLAPASALRDLAPAVDPAACPADEIVVHSGCAWFDAPRFVRALLAAARRGTVETHYGAPVAGLLRDGERVTGVRAGARTWHADTVVNCAGPGADRVAALAGARLPLRQVPGLIATSGPLSGQPLTAILSVPGLDLRPTADGGVLALSWEVDARLRGAADGLPQELHRRARDIVPGVAGARIADARIGIRPVPLDGLPLVGEAPGAPGLYHLVSHSGVTLAPVLGRLAAREITGTGPVPELAGYRPDRTIANTVHDENLISMNRRGARPAARHGSKRQAEV